MLLELAIVLLLIVLNGLFAMAEMSIVSARKARLQAAAEEGSEGARAALQLMQDQGRFLSTVQIGITLVGVLASAVGGATLTEHLARILSEIPALDGYASAVAFATVVIGITFLTLILGELVPKRLALANPEAIAAALSRPLNLMAKIAAPFGWVLNASTNLVLRLLPVSETESPAVTDEEITLMMREGAASGHFHQAESAIVQMALRLGDRRVSAVMTPRTQVDWLDLEDSEEENRAKIRGSSHSRFPVVEGGPDQVVGVVQVKDLLASVMDGGKLDIRAVMRPPLFVPDAIPALRALELLKTSGEPMALVVDEYGDFDGVLTLHDILQALVGDIASQDEEEGPSVVQRADGSWLVDGMISVDEVKDVIGLGRLPEEDSGDFHTLGGFLMARMKRVPKVADQVEVDGYNFEVVDMDGHRVDKVMITPPHLVAED